MSPRIVVVSTPSSARALVRAVSTVLALAALTPAGAQEAPGADGGGSLAAVTVTGTLIRSSDPVGFNQLQTISGEDIRASGVTTVQEFVRGLAVNSASSWGDDFAYGATGGSGLALRGLSEKYTLVLVDGLRVAPYAEPSNGTDAFVDLNAIPLNAIERIEIVKTGAVSQYGSDAVAGVVNIITKRDVTGLEVGGGYGQAGAGSEKTRKFDVVGGFGDRHRDRYNVTATASYFQQDGYTLADRALTREQNYAAQPNGFLTGGADYWEPAGAGNGGVALAPCPAGGSSTTASVLNGPGSGTACVVNTASGTSLHPDETRVNGKVHAVFEVSDTLEAFADALDSHNRTVTRQGYDGIGDSVESYDLGAFRISQVPNLVSAANPYNPYGVATALTYTFLGAPQVLTTTGDSWRVAAGLNGTVRSALGADWNWTAAASHSQNTVDNTVTGLLSVPGLASVLAGGFDFANPSATPQGLAGLYTRDANHASFREDTLDLSAASANIGHLPGGEVGLGVGAQFRHESQQETDYPNQAAALAVPFFLQSIDGQRNVAAAYYQLNLPLLTGLTFSQSSRYDHYSDFGSAFSPRFALRFQPSESLTTYASYSRGFRAPTFAENAQADSSGIQQAIDPYSPVPSYRTNPQAYPVLVRGNPALSPEHTRNTNLGVAYTPHANLSVGLDWYRVVIEDVIGTGSVQALINANDPSVVVRNANGTIAYVNFDFENLNTLETDGYELTFRGRLPTVAGAFTLSGDVAYVEHFRQTSGGVTQDFAGNDGAINTPFGASFPHVKGNLALNWALGPVSTTLTALYTGGYQQTQEGPVARTPSFTQLNLTASYTGIRNTTLAVAVKNLANATPPYYPLWLYFPTHVAFDQSLYNDEGRFVEVSARYRF